jgi:methionyl-tRNA synthetase
MPETKDTDWDWQDFVRRNNDELVATWGNLANRVLSFAFRNWDGKVPEPAELRPLDVQILETVESGFASVGELYAGVRLRAALGEALRIAGEVNKYLDTVAPWFEIKTDKQAASTSIYTALKAVDSLKILLAPVLPFSAEKLHQYLGYQEPLFGEQFVESVVDKEGEHTVLRYRAPQAGGKWQPSQLAPGQVMQQPSPLFTKLDDQVVEVERARLGN